MKKSKIKAILVKNSLLDRLKFQINRMNKPVLVFALTLFFGIAIAFILGYFYSLYNDRLFATEGIRDTLTYQGKIVNGDGVPPPDGNYNLQFKIYDAQTNGNLLWTEIWDGQAHTGQSANSQVYVLAGVFTVEMNSLCRNWVGDCASNGGVTFAQDSFYLQVELDYDANGTFEEVFSPRKRFTATPYAMNADKLDGREAIDFVLKSGATMTGELIAPKLTDSSIIAYYQFNNTAKNSSINAGLDGSLQGDVAVGSEVLDLDGAGDYILVNDNDLLSFGNGSLDTPFTFSAWINMNNAVNFPIISKGVYNSNAEFYFGTDINGKLAIKIYDESITDCYIGRIYTASALDIGSWIFVTATYSGNGSASGLKLFINGEQVDDADSSAVCSYVAMENLSSALYLGRYDANYANGLIDDIKIQNRVQGASEVRLSYNNIKAHYVNADEIKTFYLYLQALDQSANESESGYLFYDSVFNRIRSDSEIFIPNNLPALDNDKNLQDYTHFPDDNRILAYDFSVVGSNVVDLEGNANGTIGGDAFFSNRGMLGYGFVMDNNNDYISFSDPVLDTTVGALEMWAKLNNIATSETNSLVYFSESGGQQFGLVKQGTADLYAKVGDATLTDTTYDIPDTDWHHYAVTWNTGSFQVFVDGLTVYSGTYTTFTAPTTFLLGYGNTAGTSLNGYLDSVAIYDRVLADAEIINHGHSSFNTLYINDQLESGLTSSSLENLIDLPASLNEKNIDDPVFFQYTGSKQLSLGFSEGYGNTTYSNDNNDIYAAINGASWIKSGVYGQGMSFDGIDDYLEIADDSRLNPQTSDFAIEFWINGSALGNNGKKVISKRDGNTGYEIYYDSGSSSLRFFIGDGTNTVDSAATGYDFSDGKWHHFMVSFDLGGNASIFRDANYFSSSIVDISSVTGSITNSVNLLIGKDSIGNYFNGKLDSIILYDLSGREQFNYYDAFARIGRAPDSLFVIGQNTANGIGTLSVVNQSANGSGAIIGMKNPNNTGNYPLVIWTDNASSDIYNLIYFGATSLAGGTEYGNLKWDAANSKFILSQSLDVTGNLSANSLSTDSNENIAQDIIRHTLTSGEASANSFTESWSTATEANIVYMAATTLDVSANLVIPSNWAMYGMDTSVVYDGSTLTVSEQLTGTWGEGDVVTIYIVYEK